MFVGSHTRGTISTSPAGEIHLPYALWSKNSCPAAPDLETWGPWPRRSWRVTRTFSGVASEENCQRIAWSLCFSKKWSRLICCWNCKLHRILPTSLSSFLLSLPLGQAKFSNCFRIARASMFEPHISGITKVWPPMKSCMLKWFQYYFLHCMIMIIWKYERRICCDINKRPDILKSWGTLPAELWYSNVHSILIVE